MWASLPCCSLLLLVLTSLSVIRILLYWWPASMVCSIFISNTSPTQAIGRQSFVSSSPSYCGSTFGMGQKSRFAGDNVILGTKIQKERNTLLGTITVYVDSFFYLLKFPTPLFHGYFSQKCFVNAHEYEYEGLTHT